MSIFVSIASYRDPELAPTIEDCLAKARYPDQLRFGVCWQHGPGEPKPAIFADTRFRVLDVDWRDSRGACWARAELMKLWQGEDWFLQLDSHHRFAPDWDAKLLDQAKATGCAKPLLTTYGIPYTPGVPVDPDEDPMLLLFHRFNTHGIVLFRPSGIARAHRSKGPVPSRFVSAHFLFAPGVFVREVPYDPDLYFIGEEITLTIRAFTHGYDLFNPSEVIIWHEYTRLVRPKHWDDHRLENGVERSWDEYEKPSCAKVQRFLLTPEVGPFGLGTQRTFADYEAFAGINFALRRVQELTRVGGFPPNPPAEPNWAVQMRDHHIRIAFGADRLPTEARVADFWYVGIHDAEESELFRLDADKSEYQLLLAGEPSEIVLFRIFASIPEPATWKVMFYSAERGWLDVGLTGAVAVEEAAMPVAEPAQEPAKTAEPGSDIYPRALPGLVLSAADSNYIAWHADRPDERLVLNPSGVLLLEFANGRHSLSEIVDSVSDIYGLAEPADRDIVAFFESASRTGLVEAVQCGGRA